MLTEHDQAPLFTLPDHNGQMQSLDDFKDNWVLLYFYPKDDTPECITEACTIRDSFDQYKKANITVLGVSVDSVKSHAKFKQKYQLPFTLLADEQKEVVNKYGVWQLKKMFGHEYMGTVRSSFLIDPKGNIAKIYHNVKPLAHAAEVLKDFEAMKGLSDESY